MMKKFFRKIVYRIINGSVNSIINSHGIVSDISNLNRSSEAMWLSIEDLKCKSNFYNNPDVPGISKKAKLYPPFNIWESKIGDYTYISGNSKVSLSTIGKFCSIGPNFICGWGIHPINGISTSPMFYSTMKQNGITLSKEDKIEERKRITIGNDVFIGANVTILDGVNISDGAIIGAGAVVSQNIPPYSIAVGCPIKIIKNRFDDEQIEKLLQIKWWDFEAATLQDVEKYFFEVDKFINMFFSA